MLKVRSLASSNLPLLSLLSIALTKMSLSSAPSPFMLPLLYLIFLLLDRTFASAFSVSPSHLKQTAAVAKSKRRRGLIHRRCPSALSMGDKQQEKTLQLLEKARLLREQASTLENTKREAEQLVQQQQQEVQREEQQKKDAWKDRYSVVVPILKDMGEEVMEKVDFPPRIMGGEIDVLVGEIKTY